MRLLLITALALSAILAGKPAHADDAEIIAAVRDINKNTYRLLIDQMADDLDDHLDQVSVVWFLRDGCHMPLNDTARDSIFRFEEKYPDDMARAKREAIALYGSQPKDLFCGILRSQMPPEMQPGGDKEMASLKSGKKYGDPDMPD